jgi:molybdate transport repressor ModE-like protein
MTAVERCPPTPRLAVTDEWMGLELRHLIALKAIADEGSFTNAAHALGYTSSAISQQIANLERIVGAQVVAREHGRRAIGPTEAGSILLRHTTAIEAQVRAAKREIDALSQGAAGTLRVGTYESVGTRLLPEILAQFSDAFPHIRVEVGEAVLDLDLLRSLERGTLDVVFTTPPLPPGPFKERVILDDPWVLVLKRGAERECLLREVDLQQIASLPLVCFRSSRAIDAALNRFREHRLEPNVVLRSDYNEIVQGFAAAGLGVALMPLLAVNAQDARTSIVALGDLIPPRKVAIAWHSEHTTSEALKRFADLAADIGSNFHDSRHAFRTPQVASWASEDLNAQ